MEFVKNNIVNCYVNEKGVEGLPVVTLDGEIVITGRYPANDEILNLLELPAQITAKWWIINESFYQTETSDSLLKAKAKQEIKWISRATEHAKGNFAVINWKADEIKGQKLKELF